MQHHPSCSNFFPFSNVAADWKPHEALQFEYLNRAAEWLSLWGWMSRGLFVLDSGQLLVRKEGPACKEHFFGYSKKVDTSKWPLYFYVNEEKGQICSTSPIPHFPKTSLQQLPSWMCKGAFFSGSLRYGDWTGWQSCSTSCGLGGPGIEKQWMMMMTMMAAVVMLVVLLLVVVLVMVIADSSLVIDDGDDDRDVAAAHDIFFKLQRKIWSDLTANQQTLLMSWVPVSLFQRPSRKLQFLWEDVEFILYISKMTHLLESHQQDILSNFWWFIGQLLEALKRESEWCGLSRVMEVHLAQARPKPGSWRSWRSWVWSSFGSSPKFLVLVEETLQTNWAVAAEPCWLMMSLGDYTKLYYIPFI